MHVWTKYCKGERETGRRKEVENKAAHKEERGGREGLTRCGFLSAKVENGRDNTYVNVSGANGREKK